MIPEYEGYCDKCEETTTFLLDDETEQVKVWECQGCQDRWFERK